jgi:hypothetical protein
MIDKPWWFSSAAIEEAQQQLAEAEAREASVQTTAEVIAACRKFIFELLSDMPPKIDERMKYREQQFSDGELDEIRSLLAAIAKWKEAHNA